MEPAQKFKTGVVGPSGGRGKKKGGRETAGITYCGFQKVTVQIYQNKEKIVVVFLRRS